MKLHTVTLQVNAVSNTTNANFPENVYAAEIIESVFRDAVNLLYREQMNYLNTGGKKTDAYFKYIDGKIKSYEAIRNTIK
jgi:hypothetical protein